VGVHADDQIPGGHLQQMESQLQAQQKSQTVDDHRQQQQLDQQQRHQ
jgi:hypothetical protein